MVVDGLLLTGVESLGGLPARLAEPALALLVDDFPPLGLLPLGLLPLGVLPLDPPIYWLNAASSSCWFNHLHRQTSVSHCYCWVPQLPFPVANGCFERPQPVE